MDIIITAPSLDTNINVSGISAVTNFIIGNNPSHKYTHFKLGRRDSYKTRNFIFFRIIKVYFCWVWKMIFEKHTLIHFNFALEIRSIIRDSPLILLARLFGKVMIIHLHGGEYLMRKDIPYWISIVLKKVLSGKEIKITLSKIEKEVIIEKYSAKNVEVLSNCVDIKEALQYKRIRIHDQPVKILFLGRIIERKGIDIILPALKLLKEKGFDFQFILAGAGSEQEKYISKCKEFLGSSFDFKGVVTGSGKSELIKQCDIFLLPSLYGEGLPMSLLECMSFELACIVTDDGSMKDVIKSGENGIIVEKASISSLTEAIMCILMDKELREKIGKNGRDYIFKNHDPQAYINKLNIIYNQVFNKKS